MASVITSIINTAINASCHTFPFSTKYPCNNDTIHPTNPAFNTINTPIIILFTSLEYVSFDANELILYL